MITGGLDWGKGRGKGQFKHGFTEEDKSNDWYCDKCRERNFAKRTQCIKCLADKPAAGAFSWKPPALKAGQTLDGMVKSYNRRGFGFLMVLGEDADHTQDLYFTRENVAPSLDTRDIPGEHVTFEVHRLGDGKWVAINIRRQGDGKPGARQGVRGAGYQPKQYTTPPDQRRRAPSPVGGSRAFKDTLIAEMRQRQADRAAIASRSRSARRKKKKRGSSSSSDGSSSSASSDAARKKKKKKKKRRSSSSSSSSLEAGEAVGASRGEAPAVEDPGVGKAKAEALEELLRLRDRQPVEVRMSEFRALLRKWHPDKNPDRKDLATAVFQFLQRGKSMLEVVPRAG